MDIVQIGKYKISDIRFLWEELNELHGQLSTHFKEHFKNFNFADRLNLFKDKDDYTVFAVQNEIGFIGYCIASVKGSVGEIDSIYIKTYYRHLGIGENLISKAEFWLRSKGASKIIVGVAEGNESVFGFYHKYGFRHRVTILEKPA